jgi:hypothetical protein
MRSSRITLAALAALSIFMISPADAWQGSARNLHAPMIDAAAIPAYPFPDQIRAPRASSRAASRERKASRTARSSAGRRSASVDPSQGRTGYLKTTMGGIEVTVAQRFAGPAAAVIAELIGSGYQPKKLGSLSWARSHVSGSYHHRAEAIDVDQCGWGCTPAPKQVLRMIVARNGLRDGCEFRDAGHFDDGPHLPYARVLRNCGRAYADAIAPAERRERLAGVEAPDLRDPPFYAATADFKSRSSRQ